MHRRTRRRALQYAILTTALTALAAPLAATAAAQDARDAAGDAAQDAPAWQYPREISAGGVRLGLHEPAVLAYGLEDGRASLRIPVEVTDSIGRITWGALDVDGVAHLDLTSRLVLVDGMELGAVRLPDLDPEIGASVEKRLPDAFPHELLLRLELVTGRPGAAPQDEAPTGRVSTRAPKIHVRHTPAVLVQIDGDPELEKIEDFPLEYVLNTASDVFHEPSGRWLMLIDGFWAEAQALEGPWTWLGGKLPVVLTQLPINHPRGHVRRFVPGTKRYAKRVGKNAPRHPETIPEVIVSTEPAELVLLRGDPLFKLVRATKLMVVANTESDILFHPRSGTYFLLLSGRWFEASDVDGPWAPHFGPLPEEFARIPRDDARAHVLWSVPGTPESAEAAARAMLRERVFLHRRIHATIKYEGKTPRDADVADSELRKVQNTEDEVFVAGGKRYACVRGAWFVMKGAAGTWKPAESVPDALAAVPESTGAYHVTACRALGAGEKGFRFESWGPYRGLYIHKGVPVHGNGWDGAGLRRGRNWYPMPRTYGENRWYDPIAGAFRPRSVIYDAETMGARASEWTAYTASYGRVRWYADRYLQGGRRMFAYSPGNDAFDLDAPRPDVYATWAEDAVRRDGLPRERLPLGDRTRELPESGAPVVVSGDDGRAYTMTGEGLRMYVKDAWIAPPKPPGPEIAERLAALARLRGLDADLRRWAARRAAPLPEGSVEEPPR